MDSRPTPTGYQHAAEMRLQRTPEPRFTDAFRALTDIETGMTQPVVEVVEEYTDGGVLVRVSVFSENPELSRGERAAIEGLVAELRFHDESR